MEAGAKACWFQTLPSCLLQTLPFSSASAEKLHNCLLSLPGWRPSSMFSLTCCLAGRSAPFALPRPGPFPTPKCSPPQISAPPPFPPPRRRLWCDVMNCAALARPLLGAKRSFAGFLGAWTSSSGRVSVTSGRRGCAGSRLRLRWRGGGERPAFLVL